MSDLRRSFLSDHAAGVPFKLLVERYGIKKSAAYELLKRARTFGADQAVVEHSRAPKSHPNALTSEVVARVLALRRRVGWGPKKLWKLYVDEHGLSGAPSRASIGNILKQHELVRPQQQARRLDNTPTSALTVAEAPNDVWAVDHKGRMGKLGVEPLNVIDLASRYWIGCAPLVSKSYLDTRSVFELWFRQFGVPKVIRVDAGVPWISVNSPYGLTQLSSWWVSLGIRFEIARRCQLNGCIERLHGTMEREMDRADVIDVRKHFEQQRHIYNHVRPHEALALAVPASRYERSTTKLRERKHRPLANGCDEQREVKNGVIRWRGKSIFISEALESRFVGLRRMSLTEWSVRYFDLDLGTIEGFRFHPANRLCALPTVVTI